MWCVERPGIVDIDGVLEVFCSEIVGYLRHDEDVFARRRAGLYGWGTEERNVVKHCKGLVARRA